MNKSKHLIIYAMAMLLSALPVGSALAQRNTINMDKGWKFAFGNASSPEKDFGCGTEYFNYLTKANSIHNNGPYSPKFNDSTWVSVNLPHDFVVDLPFAKEASHSHGYKQVGYKYPETSVGWYRKTFHLDKADEGKHFELLFEGIFRDSRVWVNGFYCGGERSGYLSQNYDITDYLNFDGDNVICVRSDATLEEGWFYEGGGIYRHVWLTETNPVHINNDGIRIISSFKSDEDLNSPTVRVKADVTNNSHQAVNCKMRYTILDREGKTVQVSIDSVMNSNGAVKVLPMQTSPKLGKEYRFKLEDATLWNLEQPYLYTMRTEVMDENDNVLDSKDTKFGIRKIKFNKNKGFFLNDMPVKLKGVNLHQDHAGVGVGIPDALLVYRIKKLKELGCNAYRSSHNPMSPAMLDVCDSLGILVIDENRLSGISEYEVSSLKRMIDRDRNHPSIILWSAGNEEWGIEWDPKGEKISSTLHDYCKLFDSSREMTFATSGGPTVEVPTDVAGYNYIMQNPVEEMHKKYPERKCYGSEETTGCGTRGVYYDDPDKRWMKALNRAPNGKDSIMNCIERGWKFYDSHPWAAGCFFWTGFDYRGEPNPLGYPAVGSEFGILDYCGFPKDEAYYLKSWWTDKPVLHLLPHWNLQEHEGEEVDVWAYSNCFEVELFVNGKSAGRQKMPKDGHLSWKATYQPGSLKAVGYNRKGEKVLTEIVNTAGAPVSLNAVVDRNFAAADGTDMVVVDVALKDKKGNFVPTACNDVTLTIDGDCHIIGAGNGDPSFKGVERPTTLDAKEFTMPAFNGYVQFLIQAGQTAGNVKITCKADGMKASTLDLTTIK